MRIASSSMNGAPESVSGSLSGYGKAINFNGLWKPNYLLHATRHSHPTSSPPGHPNGFALLSIREPIASLGKRWLRTPIPCSKARTSSLPGFIFYSTATLFFSAFFLYLWELLSVTFVAFCGTGFYCWTAVGRKRRYLSFQLSGVFF